MISPPFYLSFIFKVRNYNENKINHYKITIITVFIKILDIRYYFNKVNRFLDDMIETTPNINLSDFVRVLKQYTSYHLWRKYSSYLSRVFWSEKTFWSDGYFIASIGEVSAETLKHYIKNQGKD